ncbi:MAG TPA: HAMP domain-containing sensor histidine kinase [Candidatus Saccharimonadales bacterium]|nr:HAMP domain-containing sensor histidine kinase [Candidatus Saccharimonadales bacterium]
MFKSARLKLTLFYLVILVAFSLVVTTSIRVLAEREYRHSSMVQRGQVHRLMLREFDFGPGPAKAFISIQEDQAQAVRNQLNQDMIMINLVALVVGGLLSYWFAGRTLRPIEEAHEAQARFAADASHELRTPLTNLRLENEVFLRQKHFTENDAKALIKSNLEEVQRLEGLSSNLLALTQYGTTPVALTPVPVRRVVDEALQQAEKNAVVKKMRFHKTVAPGKVQAHEESLVQLVGILLDNALKYGPEGGTVTIGGERQDGHYALWIQDEGPGIDEADMPYIFDRLYRGDKARTGGTGGYGLGLSLAQAIATVNGAELSAQNGPDKGARFTLRLPIMR